MEYTQASTPRQPWQLTIDKRSTLAHDWSLSSRTTGTLASTLDNTGSTARHGVIRIDPCSKQHTLDMGYDREPTLRTHGVSSGHGSTCGVIDHGVLVIRTSTWEYLGHFRTKLRPWLELSHGVLGPSNMERSNFEHESVRTTSLE